MAIWWRYTRSWRRKGSWAYGFPLELPLPQILFQAAEHTLTKPLMLKRQTTASRKVLANAIADLVVGERCNSTDDRNQSNSEYTTVSRVSLFDSLAYRRTEQLDTFAGQAGFMFLLRAYAGKILHAGTEFRRPSTALPNAAVSVASQFRTRRAVWYQVLTRAQQGVQMMCFVSRCVALECWCCPANICFSRVLPRRRPKLNQKSVAYST